MRLRTRETSYQVTLGDGAVVTLKPLSVAEMTRKAEHHTKVKNRRGHALEKVNRAALALDLWVSQVVAWEGIEDEQGAPLECTPETLRTVWNHNPEWCGEVLERLEELRANHLENEAKN